MGGGGTRCVYAAHDCAEEDGALGESPPDAGTEAPLGGGGGAGMGVGVEGTADGNGTSVGVTVT